MKNQSTPTVRVICTLLAVLAVVGLVPTATAAHNNPPSPDTVDLVNLYEQHQPFRGTANDQLDDRHGRLHLGIVEIDTGLTGDPIHHDGYAELGATNPTTTVIAATDGPGMDRFALVIDDRDAEHHRFDVTLPPDATVTHQPTGAIDVHTPTANTTLAPATAVDANGTQIPAQYRITGNQLVIDVDLDDAALPAIVDPVSANYWWGFQDWYSRSDVRRVANLYSAASIASVACNWMPGPLRSPCQKAVNRYTGWISGEWRRAKAENKCLTMRMTWTGQVIGINRYSCNWG